MQTASHLGEELKSHLPFTIFATGAGILLAGVLTYVATVTAATTPEAGVAATQAADQESGGPGHHPEHEGDQEKDPHKGHHHDPANAAVMKSASKGLFHVFHPLHMLLSAIATTAMFWRHDRNLLKAIITGVIGSIGICGISDVGLPYLSGWVLGVEMEFHWCILSHPMMVIPFMVVGVFTGLVAASAVENATQFSHAGHVFASSAASIFYLISFGLTGWIDQVGIVFVVVVIAVVIPCCLSDIVFPLLVADREGLVTCPDRNHFHRLKRDSDEEGPHVH